MQSMLEHLSAIVGEAFQRIGLDRDLGQVALSQRPDLGDYQCNGALPAAKRAKKNPRELAAMVVEHLEAHPDLAEVSLAGPGFINLRVADDALLRNAAAMLEDDRLAVEPAADAGKVVIDFGGPNVAKAMHVGHLRSSVIGESLKRLLRFLGEEVVGDIHMGDWGMPMGILIEEVRRLHPDLPYFDPDRKSGFPEDPPVTIQELEKLYPLGAERVKEDPEAAARAGETTRQLQAGHPGYRALWRHFLAASKAALRRDFEALGVSFDLWYGESTVADRLAEMVEDLKRREVAVPSEGALVIPVSGEEDKAEMPPLMLLKSDGGYTYHTTDLATLQHREEELAPDRVFYVVDQRQHLHFAQLFRAAHRAGIVREEVGLEHIAFGTVNGPDGKPFKTRAGGVMKLGDLIGMAVEEAGKRLDESGLAESYGDAERGRIARLVGIAALKFADLSNHRLSDYVFDIVKFTQFEGRTGPYLLYAAVRIKSIFTKGELDPEGSYELHGPLDEHERALLLALLRLPQVLGRARTDRAPNVLADGAWELAQEFSRFYNHCPVLKAESERRRSTRLALAQLTLRELELLLTLLGIEVPERM